MIKLRDLEYLIAIDEHRHFGRAAQACFVSQPTLSGQIMKLEQQLDLQLIERQTRKVMLTPAGEQLMHNARNVIQAAKEFEHTAKALQDPLSGDLHVGFIPTLAPYLLPHIMSALTKALPKINFYLHEEKTPDLVNALDKGELDVLVLPWLDSMEKFDRYDLFQEPLVLATAKQHPLAKKKDLSLADLKNEKILSLEDGHCLRDQAMGYCFTAGAEEDQQFRATSLETLRYMVASNMGITLLPQLATLNLSAHTNLSYQSFSKAPPVRQVSAVIRSGYSRMECIRVLVATIKNSVSDTFTR